MSMGTPDDIAIIGMAGTFAGAPDIATYWSNILGKVEAIREAPPHWLGDPDIFDPDCTPDANRIYTKLGGFLGELAGFDPRPFGQMPVALSGSEPDQFLAMRAAAEALADAGYADKDYDRKRTGIILGHGVHPHRANVNGMQHCLALGQMMGLLRAVYPGLSDSDAAEIDAMLRKKLPSFNVDTLPGLVPNMMTGRIANRFDLMGPNFIVDGACASSTLAVDAAITELRRGRADMMLAGGINTSTSVLVQIIFCKIGALSRSGRVRPFDAAGDGTLLGEGQGVVVLKRLEDALAAGDRIYAVIKGIGTASDGRAMGLMAPRFEGEQLAIQRAYQACGLDPRSVGLVEAHATGIPLGDDVEIRALTSVFGAREGGAPQVAIGSVKSMIGHAIPAAGMASLIKMASALWHKVLPPTLANEANPKLGFERTPFYLNVDALPWVQRAGAPRRAALDAMGFGGINTHMILEEAPGSSADPTAAFGLRRPRAPELFTLAAETREGLVAAAKALIERAPTHAGPLRALAAEVATKHASGPFRLAVVAEDAASLTDKLAGSLDKIAKPDTHRVKTRRGLFFADAPIGGKLAFVFPGENSQSANMLRDLALASPLVLAWLDWLEGVFPGERDVPHSSVLYPPRLGPTSAEREALEARLRQVDFGSETVFVADMALFTLLDALGLAPDAMAGHSTGENAALFASGLVEVTPGSLVGIVRRMNAVFNEVRAAASVPTGTLLTVGAASAEAIDAVMAAHPDVHLTMDNCPNQKVLFGPKQAMADVRETLSEAGAVCTELPMSWAYHTRYVAPMADAFAAILPRELIGQPSATLYSCATAAPFPTDPAGIHGTMHAQYVSRVRFDETIRRMHADGVRTFVEVGPGGVLTGFVGDILRGEPHLALAADSRRGDGFEHLLGVLAQLFANGVPFDLAPLHALDTNAPAPAKPMPVLESALPFIGIDEAEAARLRDIVGAAPAASTDAPEIAAWSGCLALPFAASVEMVGIESPDRLDGAPLLAQLAPSDVDHYEREIAPQGGFRRRDWLLGRLATRRALSRWAGDGGTHEIVYSDDGRPMLANGFADRVFLSVTHKDGIGAAAVADRPIGIDLERFSAVHDPGLFSHAAFAEDELALLDAIGWAQSDSIAIAWSAKEAAAKALGFPLIGNEAALVITDIDLEQETIALDHADGTISAHFSIDGDYVCVVAA
ncbi:putative glycolipid synthase [Beijerinckiaceae bacterium RH AL1]|nr:type I polyketide synthase [Beijerinckiaceae bacterium]VVB44278.1 putative glycolipid synthase [Beijerinckiaceae bacterium RH CH11]VVB44356.1 putative glycolipid synthase [Beijerinckiaceae bacterium RH AL8]VVC54272.1 putative glycolipid synthase [Beijerinckiaceae bacterium RH AL1]